jgi:hypothetical protein
MTRTNIIWAIGVSLASVWFGVSIMFGHVPGLDSGVGTFERIAALAAMAVDKYGYVLTGLGGIGAWCSVPGRRRRIAGQWHRRRLGK